ncbi:MAG: Holliday junction resolvase RuvX [Flavobacteriales bacterium]|nr:Holliday junction resolvase RuvX [Bacteroidota bacterium]MCB9239537.1 Holliday junction resolvase RuvX [Flavobacteriales bacterium]
MARILSIDFGGKRTGLAVTDPMQIIASELRTVPTDDLLDFLMTYTQSEVVETIVVGQPRRMDGSLSDIETRIVEFIEKLREKVAIPIVRYDERFTSKMAGRSLIESGVKKKDRRDKSRLDSISATLILQDYLASRS